MIRHYVLFQFKLWFISPLVWLALVVYTLTSGIFLNIFYFSHLASQNQTQLPVTENIVVPFFGLLIVLFLLLTPLLLALQNHGTFGREQNLFATLPISPSKLLISKYLSACLLMLGFFAISVGMTLSLLLWMELDSGIYLSSSIGVLVILNLIVTLALAIANSCRSQIESLVIAFMTVIFISLIEMISQQDLFLLSDIAKLLSFLSPFRLFRDGSLPIDEMVRLIALAMLLLTSTLALNYWRVGKTNFIVLSGTVISLALLTSSQFWRWDLSLTTATQQEPIPNSLQQPLRTLPAPIHITGFTQAPEMQMQIQHAFRYFLRYNSKIQLTFSDAQLQPQHKSLYAHSTLVRLRYLGNSEYLHFPISDNQQIIAQAFSRLLRANPIIAFLEGNGERSPFGEKNRDLSKLAKVLSQSGFQIQGVNLEKLSSIPINTQLLVVASPTRSLPAHQQSAIVSYLEQGGNLLWLSEPETAFIPTSLTKILGIQQLPGTVIDPNGLSRGTPHPAIALIDRFPTHPITTSLDQLVALPFSAALNYEPKNWQLEMQLTSKASSWRDTSTNLEEALSNPTSNQTSEQTLLVALSNPDHPQRVMITGGGHFFSDAAIHNYGNKQLAQNILFWLSHQQLDADSVAKAPTKITPSWHLNFLMIYFYPWLLPGLMLLMGALLYYRRHRQYAS